MRSSVVFCGSALPGAILLASRARKGAPTILAAALLLLCPPLRAADDAPRVVTPPAASTFNAFTQFAEVLKTLQGNYIDPAKASSPQHVTTALREFVRSLDPDTELYAPGELDMQPADSVPFGAALMFRNSQPTVISPRDRSTAQQAGLLSGEQIIAINDIPTGGLRLIEIYRQLDGRPGDKCLLRLLDPGHGPREIVVRRVAPQPPPRPTIQFLDAGIGYIRLGDFAIANFETLAAILDTPPRQRPAGLILDLRNNPGGELRAVHLTAQLFLPARTPIVTFDYPRTDRQATFISDNPSPFTTPLVLLINAGTAREAEIFAAAMRDNKRARLVGATTCGLGRKFENFPLPDGSQLSLPVAFYSPRFDATGIAPDVLVVTPRDAERKLAAAGFGQFDWPRNKKEILAHDRVLAKALELLSK